jgi:hypothetical protein
VLLPIVPIVRAGKLAALDRRGGALEKRRQLMAEWAAFVGAL